MRRLIAPALAVALSALPIAAHAGMVLTLGIYLWTNPDSEPARAQYMSIASDITETETEGPAGYHSGSHPVKPGERSLIEAAIVDRMKALTLNASPRLPTPYVTVEWHFSHDTGYAEGIGSYALKDVPAAVSTFQKGAFGADYSDAAR